MGRSIELATARGEDTRELGRAVASLLTAGDVVVLTGELGAGKTTFVQGAAAGLGVTGPVLSPTFTLVREYSGDVPVYHVDVYRLERLQEVIDLGFEELLGGNGIVFVEWGDVVSVLLPEEYLEVELSVFPEDERRLVVLQGAGRPWAERWERLETLAQPWMVELET